MSQIMRRRVHFGEMEFPADPDHLVLHQAMLAQLIDESYDWEK
ncbi:hypothetical protein [Rhodococcus phenolicus]|nr:hypothetical protein [Rhodococcus phenolicus]